MSGRYTTKEGHHPSLGPTVDVWDTETRRPLAPYAGPYARERAEQRVRELNAQNDEAGRENDR